MCLINCHDLFFMAVRFFFTFWQSITFYNFRGPLKFGRPRQVVLTASPPLPRPIKSARPLRVVNPAWRPYTAVGTYHRRFLLDTNPHLPVRVRRTTCWPCTRSWRSPARRCTPFRSTAATWRASSSATWVRSRWAGPIRPRPRSVRRNRTLCSENETSHDATTHSGPEFFLKKTRQNYFHNFINYEMSEFVHTLFLDVHFLLEKYKIYKL